MFVLCVCAFLSYLFVCVMCLCFCFFFVFAFMFVFWSMLWGDTKAMIKTIIVKVYRLLSLLFGMPAPSAESQYSEAWPSSTYIWEGLVLVLITFLLCLIWFGWIIVVVSSVSFLFMIISKLASYLILIFLVYWWLIFSWYS